MSTKPEMRKAETLIPQPIFYRTISLEISGTDEALVTASAAEIGALLNNATNQQLKRSAVRLSNQLYSTVTKPGKDLNSLYNREPAKAKAETLKSES